MLTQVLAQTLPVYLLGAFILAPPYDNRRDLSGSLSSLSLGVINTLDKNS